MKKVKDLSGNITIAIICLLLGVILSMQLKTIKKAKETNLTVARSREDTLQTQIQQKDIEIEDLKMSLLEYQNAAVEGDQVLKAELKKMQILAGTLKVQGKGIVINLDDGVPTDLARPEDYLIHDADLLLLVNELKTLGAEAISINNLRIAANTDIRCAGATILINSEKVVPPLTINAIGDPDTLEKGLTMAGGVYHNFAPFLSMTIKKEENVVVNAYNKFSIFKYASPVEEEEIQ